jgi:hypothetical protein
MIVLFLFSIKGLVNQVISVHTQTHSLSTYRVTHRARWAPFCPAGTLNYSSSDKPLYFLYDDRRISSRLFTVTQRNREKHSTAMYKDCEKKE